VSTRAQVRAVGRVVATDDTPATPHQFYFWSAGQSDIGVGSIVRVGDGSRTVYAVVEDASGYEGVPRSLEGAIAGDVRGELRVWRAAVLRQIPAEPVQPVPLGDVFVADDADVVLALRMDTYTAGAAATGIPVGLYEAGGRHVPVLLDAEFLLGPEAAHLSISGISGLATKTSAVEFLLASVFQRLPSGKGSIAAVCFNLKGPDLLFLDRPATLDDEDRARYASLNLEPTPFGAVRYFAPYKADGLNLNTLRTHEALIGSVEPLVWGLGEVLEFAQVLLNRDDLDAKADAFVDFLADRVFDKDFVDDSLSRPHRVQTFADLDALFRDILDAVETRGSGATWRTHHVATIRKVRNRLSNVATRSKGLVTEDGPSHDLPWGEFADRTLYVIDLANVDPLAQDLVFARVVSKLREHLERRDLGVDQVVVFVDELNKYAPAEGDDTYVRQMLLDLAERGRYLGLVLFGAQQFRSQVHRRVVGNAGTVLFGRTDMDELATAGYHVLSPATKIRLATLPKGELLVRHPHFTHPVFLRFPRPPVLRGRDGIERYPPALDLPFADAVIRQLVRLDARLDVNAARDAIASRRESDVVRALHAVRRARPARPLAHFLAHLGGRVPGETVSLKDTRPLVLSDDPYGA